MCTAGLPGLGRTRYRREGIRTPRRPARPEEEAIGGFTVGEWTSGGGRLDRVRSRNCGKEESVKRRMHRRVIGAPTPATAVGYGGGLR
jgi:hypothetical protein